MTTTNLKEAVWKIFERIDDDIHYNYEQAVPDLRKLFAAELVEEFLKHAPLTTRMSDFVDCICGWKQKGDSYMDFEAWKNHVREAIVGKAT